MVKKYFPEILFSSIVFLVVILDQLTKYLILKFNPNLTLNFLKIHLVKNTGAGFGILKDYTWLLDLISLVVVVFLICYYPKITKEKFSQILAALFLGGTIGNLIDRLLRKFVVDFIDFSFWPAFNIADASITIGAIGLIIYFWKK